MPVSAAKHAPLPDRLTENLKRFVAKNCDGACAVAVAVSGGPDSMALLRVLSDLSIQGGPKLQALSVDHGLRPEAAAEARQVGMWVRDWPGVTHRVLRWEAPARARIQENARKARYDLMAAYCRENGIAHLFLAHHRDDQAETFLFRLAKGSGLDGLSGMRAVQAHETGLTLLRPLLDVAKAELADFCTSHGVIFARDPSNESERFARVRLRRSAKALEAEGLSAKRLAVTAHRLGRARAALEALADEAYGKIMLERYTDRIVLELCGLRKLAAELGLRCVLRAIAELRPGADYAPRMESIEALFDDLLALESFRKRTLGGLVFARDDVAARVTIECETRA